MWRLLSVLLCMSAAAGSGVLEEIINILQKKEVNLGAYDVTVNIGRVPDITEMTELDEKASLRGLNAVEILRDRMYKGILTLPALDPYENSDLDSIVITPQDSPLVSGKIEIVELKVEGAKAFQLNSLEIRLDTQRIDFDLKIPSLHGLVVFYTDLKLRNILPIKIAGILRFNIKGISLGLAVGTTVMDHNGDNIYQVQSAQGAFHADEVRVNLERIRGRFLQDIVRFLKQSNVLNKAPAVEGIEELINNYIITTVKEEVNKALLGFTVDQIKKYLLS